MGGWVDGGMGGWVDGRMVDGRINDRYCFYYETS